VRSGAQVLLLLAAPLNLLILRSLEDGTKPQAELLRATGGAAQTTLRAQLRKMVEIGAIEKHRRNRFPGMLEYKLTGSGRDLLFVAEILARWLEQAPANPLVPGSDAAKAAVKALAESWSTTMLRVLAAGPRSLTELDRVIGGLSYPSLERRLARMRLTGQIEARPGSGRGTPYAVTGWLRQGISPLAAAARWERRHMPRTTPPLTRLDVEAAFLLAVPLLRLPATLSGSCRLATEIIPNSRRRRLAGVVVEIEGGTVESCVTNLDRDTDAWVLGSVAAWLEAVIEGGFAGLESGGDHGLVQTLPEGLHEVLFGTNLQPVLDSDPRIREDGSD
jgi:DNA-binding HxlR family transcriptional regulator